MILNKSQNEWSWYAFLVFLFLISWTQLADYDFWWHLNLGRQVAEQGTPVVRDAFSYTFVGAPQFNGEWLGDLIFYLVFAAGGFSLINLLKFGLLVVAFYCLRKTAEEVLAEQGRVSPAAVIVALVLIAFAIRFRLFVRPFLFSYCFVALMFWILTVYRRRRDPRLLGAMLLIELLWANTSKGFFFEPLLIALWIGFDLLDRRVDYRLCLLLLGVAVVALINPEGLATYRPLFDFIGQEDIAVVGEHQPLSVALLWGGGLAYTWGFQVLVVLALSYFVLWKGWRDARAGILFLLFLLPAVMMIRMIDFFSFAAIFAVVPALAHLLALPVFAKMSNRRWTPLVAAAALVAIGVTAVMTTRSYAFGAQAKQTNIPGEALTFLEKNDITGRIFNSYPYGGYIAWRNPALPVNIDGRVNQLYPPQFHKHYFELIHSPTAWNLDQKEWGYEIAVIEYNRMDGGRHFPRHLAENKEWALVFWDDHSAVWLKRVPRFAAIIDRFGYRLARPAFYELAYLNELRRTRLSATLLADARHDVALNPDNQEARLANVFILYALDARKYAAEIISELNTCLALEPNLAIEHSALGMIFLEAGRTEAAADQARQALQLDPGDNGGLYLKEKLGGRL